MTRNSFFSSLSPLSSASRLPLSCLSSFRQAQKKADDGESGACQRPGSDLYAVHCHLDSGGRYCLSPALSGVRRVSEFVGRHLRLHIYIRPLPPRSLSRLISPQSPWRPPWPVRRPGYSGYPMFKAPDALADALAADGFDMVNLASNHVYDGLDEGTCPHHGGPEPEKISSTWAPGRIKTTRNTM